MLLDLPSDVLHAVYDMLLVEDRRSLNSALPRQRRIRTSADLDRKLHCISTGLKRLSPEQRKRVVRGRDLSRFLEAHPADPTVRRIADADDEGGGGMMSPVDALVVAIQAKDARAARAVPASDLQGNAFHASDVVRALIGSGAVEALLPELLEVPLFVDALRIYTEFWKSSFLFDLIVRREGAALRRLFSLPDPEARRRACVAEENVEHFWTNSAMHVCVAPDAAEFMLETMAGHVTERRLASLVETCVSQLNVPVLEVLLGHPLLE